MKTIVPLILLVGLPVLAHEIMPAQPPDGPWSLEVDYSVRGTNGTYFAYRGFTDSDRRFRHDTPNGRAGKVSLQPPRLKVTREQAASLYVSAASAFNSLEVRPGRDARSDRSRYQLTRLSIILGNRKLSFDTQQEPPPSIIAVIEKFREISRAVIGE